jgi:bifunctional DNase/RNase
VQYVRVDKLEDNVFIGTVVVRQGARLIELDARSSDAVALALGKDVPIFVAKKVVEFTGVDLDRIQQPSDGENEPPSGPDLHGPDPRRADPVML